MMLRRNLFSPGLWATALNASIHSNTPTPLPHPRMAAIQWGPWSGAGRGSSTGHAAVTPPIVPAADLATLQKMMLSMLTDPSLSDVCLVVEGREVAAHKAVLAAWSRPFRAMFTLPMLESQHRCKVVIEDVEHKHLMVVLQYIYGGRIGLTDQNVVPVSALANRYEVLPLMAQCEGYMKWRLCPSNVCQQLLAAEEHRVPKAVDVALEYLAVHFDEVQHDPLGGDFNSLGGETVLRMLQHDGLTADEETVFLAVDGWAKAWKRREATRGAATNFAVFGRSPPPAVAEQSRQTSGSSSTNRNHNSRSVKKTVNAADLPVSKKIQPPEAQDTRRQRGGNGCRSGAGGTEHPRLGRQTGAITDGCASGESAVVPLPVETAGAAAAVSGATAAGAAAAARRRAEEEQQANGEPLVPAAAAAAAAAAGPNATSTVPPSSPDSSRSTSPALDFGAGTVPAVGRGHLADQLSVPVVAEDSRKGTAGETVRGGLQRRASGSYGGKERQGGWVGSMKGRAASFSHPPPPPGSSAVVRGPGSSGPVAIDVSVGAGEEATASMPDGERAFVDELLMEVRFPLISTSFLCQVVEKSPTITGSKVAQRLLLEAYRFQAMTSTDAVDVDEHFPGNHRVKFRGHERVLFGEGDSCVGTVDDFSSSLSEVHLVENVKRKDDKYWLPGQPEEAYFCVRLDRVRRLTKVRFQNRYSEEFEVAVRRTRKEEWQVIVPRRMSGGHKDVQEIDLTRKRVNARHVKISLRGRKRLCYNTSCYWTELLGF